MFRCFFRVFVALGITLRHSPLPRVILAYIYLSIGGALFLSSLAYYRLLAGHPALAGLAVPGMVTGSPGMEGPGAQSYDVIAWNRDGKTTIYARR